MGTREAQFQRNEPIKLAAIGGFEKLDDAV